MPHRATSAFTIDQKDAEPAVWRGGQMSRTRWQKTFTGDLTGTSVVEAIMLGLDEGGPMVYVGIERFDCTVEGRTGTFVLLHSATHHGSGGLATWTIVPGSGTGELTGIRGHGEMLPKHEFALSYEIG
jgi:Protein of unknown function (DUF3224)